MKLPVTLLLCCACVISKTESKGRRPSLSKYGSIFRSIFELPARVSELEELFQNYSSWLQALQDQINGLSTLQDFLTLNQTLQDQADAVQALQGRLTDLESCVCSRLDTLEIHSPVAYTWDILGDDCVTVPCNDTFITFQVKACRDAHILLMQDNSTTMNIYKLVIGGWANTRSAIRLQQGSPNQAQIDNDPLDCDEFRPFWASWESGVIRMGTGLTVGVDEFISYTDATPTQVNQVAVATNNIVGDWIINGNSCTCQD